MAVGDFDYLVRAAGPKLTSEREMWMTDALCAETDPDLFFPAKWESAGPAKRVCGGCAVAVACLDYAVANNLTDGVWGGLSAKDRRELRRSAA